MPQIRRHHAVFAFVFLLLWGAASPAAAQSGQADQPDVPEPLQPWVGWVLHDQPDLMCPQMGDKQVGNQGQRICEWPGTLEVDADEEGARFVMQVWLARKGAVQLPGGEKLWPQRVRAGGGPAIVKEVGGLPAVELEAGTHRLTGAFEWTSVPEVLPAPAHIGHVSLTLRGNEMQRPRLDAKGRLWMDSSQGPTGTDETDSIRTSIYRRIEDGSPMRVITQIELNVSGKAREIDMGQVLVEGSRPTGVRSPLPVEVNRDGKVSVYARPGTHQVTVEAVITERLDKLSVPEPEPDFYDPQEVWVWIPDEAIRTVELSGLQTVDPARTSLPEDWRGHTTFLAEPNDTLQLQITRRGKSPSPNAVALHRQMWLDVDGDGFTVRDRLSGTMQRDWRLDYTGPAALGRVYDQKANDDVLITENPDSGKSGVELRQSSLDLTADLRLDSATKTLPAVGWDHDVQRLSATLNLPPGWTLFAAGGADEVDGTWIDSWTLWDFFFVLMVALAIGKLLGWRWTPLAILALVLSHGHGDAPMWVWIHLVASLALLRALPDGWWRKGVYVYRAIALLVLFGVLANFAHDQVRAALHPQVDSRAFRTGGSHGMNLGMADQEQMAAEPNTQRFADVVEEKQEMAADEAPAPQQKRAKGDYRKERVRSWASSGKYKKKIDLEQIDPKAVVQTGPGMPNWSWNSWRMSWNGPVHKEHEVRLWLVSPVVNRLLTFLRVALLIVLSLLVLAMRDMAWRKNEKPGDGGDSGGGDDGSNAGSHDGGKRPGVWRHFIQAGVAFALGVAVLGASPEAVAQNNVPNADQFQFAGASSSVANASMLDTLRKRMVEARTCDGVCVVVSRADFVVDGLDLTMTAEVHAQKDSGWHLPGPADPLRIESVRIDGVATSQFRREPGGLTAVRVPQGRHTLEVSGQLANRNVATIQFDNQTRPKKVHFASDHWTVDGLSSTGVPDSSLQLTRKEGADAGPLAGAQKAQELPPWYHVERFVGLGLPWKVRTTVSRERADRPQLVKIPLIDGESVTTDGIRIKDGQALVDFPRGEHVVEYVSEIPIRDHIELVAPTDQPWSETWTVECSRIWRCGFSDLPPVDLLGDDDIFRPTWKPWPGETLGIDVERPEGAGGQSSTVDNVEYRVTPGKRLLQATLDLTIRASQGGSQTLTLPEGAELQSTTIDGSERSLRLDGRKLDLPIRPGEHTYCIEWQQPWERGFVERMPEVDIGAPAANVELFIERGQERWLLRTTGPEWGPAVLFWARLVILLLIAVLLSRLRGLPLKLHEWMLLVVGMSQLPYLALIPVVAWFAALTLRKKSPPQKWWKFDLAQLVVIGLTLAAAITLYAAVHTNLLINVDMQVSGANSYDSMLRWYVDRSDGALPTPAILSVPLLVWRILMLAWAFWLVSRLLAWVPWGWSAFSEAGLWRKRPGKTGVPSGQQEEDSDEQADAPPEANGDVDKPED